jgi:hypothetical protein
MLAIGGESHNIAGKGHVQVKLLDGQIKQFKNDLYVPNICRNLLFVGCIVDQGYIINFNSIRVTIVTRKTEHILCNGTRMKGQGLYKLDFQPILEEICNIEKDDNKTELALLWHKRLGHMNFKDLHQLS